MIDRSYTSLKSDADIPMEPHALHKSESSFFELDFIHKKKLHNYTIEFTQKEILRESLSRQSERMRNVFTFIRTETGARINAPSLAINPQDKKRFKSRKNVPLLSSLIDTGYFPEIDFFKKYSSNVTQLGFSNFSIRSCIEASNELSDDSKLQDLVLSHIKNSDLGISNFDFKDISVIDDNEGSETERDIKLVEVLHKSSSANFKLNIFEESNGTQHSFALLCKILPTLQRGGVVIVDEIDAGIHPYIVKKIIALFENQTTNPKNSQLFFSTHQHLLLKDRTKTQIFIAERSSENFETDIFRLDDLEGIRNDENYFSKYIAGTYGGTPNINWL